MNNMVAGDVVEEMGTNDSKIAIDSCGCSPKKGPVFGRILGNIWMSVVQERDHDNEVVDDTPRNNVDPKEHFETLHVPVKEVETGDSG